VNHDQLKALVRDIPDFPQEGIVFKDITPLLADELAFSTVIDLIVVHFGRGNVDKVVGIEARGSLAEGMFISTGYLPDEDSPANRRFVEAYHKRYPEAIPPDQGAAATYDAVRLLAKVIKEAGPDRRRIRDVLAAVGQSAPPYEGVVGTIAFDRNGDVPQLAVQIGVVRSGRLVSAEAR